VAFLGRRVRAYARLSPAREQQRSASLVFAARGRLWRPSSWYHYPLIYTASTPLYPTGRICQVPRPPAEAAESSRAANPRHRTEHERSNASARGSFATPPSSQVDNPRVLLLDHVLTSGATRDPVAESRERRGQCR
jgi:hypothetical protein